MSGFKPTFEQMTAYARNIWKGIEVPRVVLIKPGVFMFKFREEETRQKVFERRWYFAGVPMIIKEWTPDFNPDNLDLSTLPVWLHLPNLHYSLWNSTAIGKIASYLGKPLATDGLTAVRDRLTYARVLVEMKISLNLPKFIPVTMPRGIYRQHVIYEWKPTYCQKCLMLGHSHDECTVVLPTRTEWKEIANHNPKPGEEVEEAAGQIDKGKERIQEGSSSTDVGGKDGSVASVNVQQEQTGNTEFVEQRTKQKWKKMKNGKQTKNTQEIQEPQANDAATKSQQGMEEISVNMDVSTNPLKTNSTGDGKQEMRRMQGEGSTYMLPLMSNIAHWNARGMNDPLRQRECKEFP